MKDGLGPFKIAIGFVLLGAAVVIIPEIPFERWGMWGLRSNLTAAGAVLRFFLAVLGSFVFAWLVTLSVAKARARRGLPLWDRYNDWILLGAGAFLCLLWIVTDIVRDVRESRLMDRSAREKWDGTRFIVGLGLSGAAGTRERDLRLEASTEKMFGCEGYSLRTSVDRSKERFEMRLEGIEGPGGEVCSTAMSRARASVSLGFDPGQRRVVLRKGAAADEYLMRVTAEKAEIWPMRQTFTSLDPRRASVELLAP